MPRILAALALTLAVATPAGAATLRADDHGTKVVLNKKKLTVTFTKKTDAKIKSFIVGKEVTMGCADADMKVLGSRTFLWTTKNPNRRKVRFADDLSAVAHFCFVASPEQVEDGVLQGARVLGFLRGPTPNV